MRRAWPAIAAAAAVAVFPLLPFVPEFWITLGNYIGLSSLVAMGLVLLTGVGGMTSFGQAAFVGIGAYATAVLSTTYGVSPWLTLPVALVVTAVAALAIGIITVPLSGHYLPLGTIAWGISIFHLFGNLPWLGAHDGISGIPYLSLGGRALIDGRAYWYLTWGSVAGTMVVTLNLLDSRVGRAIRALRAGAVAAESFGVDTARSKLIIFVYAALLAGLSGWLFAHFQRAISPSAFGVNLGIEYLFMAVLGGAGHVFGAVLGAAIVAILKDQLQNLLPRILGDSGNFDIIVFGVLLLLIMQTTRDGLWPFVRRLFPLGAPPEDPADAPPLVQRERPPRDSVLLEVRDLTKSFGGLVAVSGVNFGVRAGEIVGLIGPNGAGKTTTFNLITGLAQQSSGEVRFLDRQIDGMAARHISRLGIARTFQHVKLVPDMTVLDNVALGAHLRGRAGVVAAMLRGDRAEEGRLLKEAARLLERVGLAELMHRPAVSLALGQSRIVEIARALCLDPLLLLLDEPAAGLRHREKAALAVLLRRLRDEGIGILLVEHDMDFVMGLADRLVVLDFGALLAEGKPGKVRREPAVIEAYLGGVE